MCEDALAVKGLPWQREKALAGGHVLGSIHIQHCQLTATGKESPSLILAPLQLSFSFASSRLPGVVARQYGVASRTGEQI